MMVFMVLLLSGSITMSLSGFAVDKDDNVYIGTERAINVYRDGTLLREINPRTSRAYQFTINADNQILLATSTNVYLMDILGTVVEEPNISALDTYSSLSWKKSFVSASGDIYQLKHPLGWTRIVKNGTETVYKVSLLSYVMKILLIVMVPVFCISVIRLVASEIAIRRTGDGSAS